MWLKIIIILIVSALAQATTLQDFAVLSSEWLTCRLQGYTPQADYDKSGCVDLLDYQILAEEWLMANKIAQFDGTTGCVTVPSDAALNLGNTSYSICGVTTFNSIANYKTIIHRAAGGGDTDFYITTYNSRLYLRSENTSSNVRAWTTTNTISAGVLYFWAFVWNGTNGVFYLNEDAVPTTLVANIGSYPNLDSPGHLVIGAAFSGSYVNFLSGSLDDLRIYKAALTETEIANIYKGGIGCKYNASQTPTSGTASFVLEFDSVPDGENKIYDTINPALAGTLSETGVTITDGGVPFSILTGVTEMADFNYHPDTYASTICFKINAPGIEKTWNMTSLALESTISTAAQGFTDVNWDAIKAGYPITIPQTLPRGSYDILFFLAAKSAITTTDVPETGFSFKWSGKALLAPVQRLTDFVA